MWWNALRPVTKHEILNPFIMLRLVAGECGTADSGGLESSLRLLHLEEAGGQRGRISGRGESVQRLCYNEAPRYSHPQFFLIPQTDGSLPVPVNGNFLSLGMARWRSFLLFCSSDALLSAANGFPLDLVAASENILPWRLTDDLPRSALELRVLMLLS